MNLCLIQCSRNLETNEDYMPFIHSLTENTIKGSLSIAGYSVAGTSNSEFEFLSGDSISFLPTGCNVYQSYVKDTVPSLVSTWCTWLFQTAFHPYYGEGWNRRNVYPLLGLKTISVSKILFESGHFWILTSRTMTSPSMRCC